jgi:hypothetical protein
VSPDASALPPLELAPLELAPLELAPLELAPLELAPLELPLELPDGPPVELEQPDTPTVVPMPTTTMTWNSFFVALRELMRKSYHPRPHRQGRQRQSYEQ